MDEKQYPDGKDAAQTLTSQVITSSDRLPPPPLTSEGATSGAVWVRDTEKKNPYFYTVIFARIFIYSFEIPLRVFTLTHYTDACVYIHFIGNIISCL